MSPGQLSLSTPDPIGPLQALLDNLPDPFFTLDDGWRFTSLNGKAAAFLGRDAGALLGAVCWKVYPDLLGTAFERQAVRALSEGVATTGELYHARRDRWLWAQAFPHGGGLAVLLRDVTERRRAELRKDALHLLTRRLGEGLGPNEVARVIVDTGRHTVGASGGALYLMAPGGAQLDLLSASGFAPEVLPAWRRVALDSDTPVGGAARAGAALFLSARDFAQGYPSIPSDLRGGSVAAMPLCAHGRVLGALGFSFAADHPFDRGERQFLESLAAQCAQALERVQLQAAREQVAQDLLKERGRLEAVLDQMPVAVWIAEIPGGKLLAGNAAIDRMLRHPFLPAENIERYAQYVGFHPDGRRYEGSEWPLARTVLSGERVTDQVVEMRRGDGTRCFVSLSSAPILDAHGVPVLAVVTGVDVTERVGAEARVRELNATLEARVRDRTAELEAANQELEAFGYSVSHDLRAPLRHVRSFAALLRRKAEGQLDPASLKYLSTIESSAEHMGSLIDELLEFSRLARQPLRLRTVDLDALVASVRAGLAPDLAGRQIEWTVAPLPTVRADPALLRVVLTNLLSNAVKYTEGRDPARIALSAAFAPGEVVVRLGDNGAGFDPRYAHKLFGVFQRLHRQEDFEGVGVGLATVQRIVTRHGGRVWAEGQPGEGATFFFTLPRANETPSSGPA